MSGCPPIVRRYRCSSPASGRDRFTAPWTFTLITSADAEPARLADIEILAGLDAVDCLDVFASAEVVIGNDTGLTHLAALTEHPDGTGPHVIGLYGRHGNLRSLPHDGSLNSGPLRADSSNLVSRATKKC